LGKGLGPARERVKLLPIEKIENRGKNVGCTGDQRGRIHGGMKLVKMRRKRGGVKEKKSGTLEKPKVLCGSFCGEVNDGRKGKKAIKKSGKEKRKKKDHLGK